MGIVGLESVELLLTFEEEFGIRIDDSEAASLQTPAQLADHIYGRLTNADGKERNSLAQAGFYRLRSVLVRQFGAVRSEITPDTPISGLLRGDIRSQWLQLKSAIDAAHLPGLRCSRPVSILMMLGLPVAAGAGTYFLGAPSWAVVLVLFLFWLVAAMLADRFGTVVPEGLNTVGALVPYVSITTPDEWTHALILERIRMLTASQLGIPVERVAPDAGFADDLGLR